MFDPRSRRYFFLRPFLPCENMLVVLALARATMAPSKLVLEEEGFIPKYVYTTFGARHWPRPSAYTREFRKRDIELLKCIDCLSGRSTTASVVLVS